MKNVIYKISNSKNDKFYIGSAMYFNRRYNQHKHNLINGTHHNPILQNIVKKYGFDCLIFEIIFVCGEKDDLLQKEDFYIKTLKPTININNNAINQKGLKRSPEQISRMIQGRLNNSGYKKGYKRSPEICRKIGDAHKGKVISDAHKKSISRSNKGRQMSVDSKNKISLKLKGRIFSLSHKEKLSKSMIGNSNYKNVDYKSKERSDKISKALSIPVFKYSLSGEFISKYESLKEASMKNNGISKSNINMVINGKRKTCGGFIWKRN